MTRFHTAALLTALLLGSTATASLAEDYEVVTRGPNGAGFVVKRDRIPIASHQQPKTEPRTFPNVIPKGPGGAGHIQGTQVLSRDTTTVTVPELVNRGPNGASLLR